jgi:hypothetical protein
VTGRTRARGNRGTDTKRGGGLKETTGGTEKNHQENKEKNLMLGNKVLEPVQSIIFYVHSTHEELEA